MFREHTDVTPVILNQTKETPVINALNTNIMKIIYPLYVTQKIFISSNYVISNNIITPIRTTFKTVKLLFFVAIFILCSYLIIFGNEDYSIDKHRKPVLRFIVNFIHLFRCSYLVTLCLLNIIYSQDHVKLILRIQCIFEKDILNREHTQCIVIWSWFMILTVTTFSFTSFISFYIIMQYFSIESYLLNFLIIAFDIKLIYAIFIMKLLKIILTNFSKTILSLSNSSNEHCEEMLETYETILATFDLFKKVFHILVFLHCSHTFLTALFNIQAQLETIQGDSLNLTYNDFFALTIFDFLEPIKNIVLAILLCINCEKFYTTVEDIGAGCLKQMTGSTENTKKLYKKVIQLNRHSFSKMSACGLFLIDAGLPLSLSGLLTNYVIVLLQFTFLK